MTTNRSVLVRNAPIGLPSRWLAILKELGIQSRTVTELQGLLNVEQNTLSTQLGRMVRARLVSYTKVRTSEMGVHGGTTMHQYHLEPEGVAALCADIHGLAAEIEGMIQKKKKGQKP